MSAMTRSRPSSWLGRGRRAKAFTPRPDERALDAFEEQLDYRFQDRERLIEALTHSSVDAASDARASKIRINERLEFLGDRVLGLMTAEALILAFPDAPEGDLAPRLNALVRKETCAEVALECGLDRVLILAASERSSGGAAKPAILGDACEALIAALYLDGGRTAAQAFFDRFWGKRLQELDAVPRDPKTSLQEWIQGRSRETPSYRILDRRGPDHAPEFDVEVLVPGFDPATGTGPSRRAAERAAAQAVLVREGVVPASDDEGAGPGHEKAHGDGDD
ncbi:MAG: ribonuclease III [Alphaproteobacteria bacterium]